MIEKLALPFGLLSDPEGRVIKDYELWNERESIAIPSIVVADGEGEARYVYAGADFSDRPGDEPVFDALAQVSRP